MDESEEQTVGLSPEEMDELENYALRYFQSWYEGRTGEDGSIAEATDGEASDIDEDTNVSFDRAVESALKRFIRVGN